MAFGRPTLYDPKYCKMLIDHMATGLSFYSFAGEIGVCEDTVCEWALVHKDFSDAKKEGLSKNLAWWEKAMKDGTIGKIRNFNATMAIFNMKNRFPSRWRDRQEVETTNTTTTEIKVTKEFRKELVDELLSIRKNEPDVAK